MDVFFDNGAPVVSGPVTVASTVSSPQTTSTVAPKVDTTVVPTSTSTTPTNNIDDQTSTASSSHTSDNTQKSEEANLFSPEASWATEDANSASTSNPTVLPNQEGLSLASNFTTVDKPPAAAANLATMVEGNEPSVLHWYRCIDGVDPFLDASVFDVDYRYTIFGSKINDIDSNQVTQLESQLLHDVASLFECKSSAQRFLEEAIKYPSFVGFQGSGSNRITDQRGM